MGEGPGNRLQDIDRALAGLDEAERDALRRTEEVARQMSARFEAERARLDQEEAAIREELSHSKRVMEESIAKGRAQLLEERAAAVRGE